MFDGSNSLLSIVAVGLLIGVAAWGLLYGLALIYGGSRARVKSRMRQFVSNPSQPDLDEDQVRAAQRETLFAELDSRWEDQSLFKSLHDEIQAADLRITPTELLLIQVGIGVGLALVLWITLPFLAIVLVPVGFLLAVYSVRSYVKYLGRRRVARFEEQLANNLAMLAGSVRGGFSLFQAMQLMARESAEPSKTEFTRVIQEITLGNPMSTALDGLSKRIPTEDVEILVTAITMQQQTGGNLTHVLDVVASTIRERHRVSREIRALTSQQRFSAILLAALPFALLLLFFFISPQYVSNLFQPGWVLCMPIGALILSLVGFVVMRRMADIDV